MHGQKYCYKKVKYNGYHKPKVWIGCPIHGYFPQSPRDHLYGCGCDSCPNEAEAKVRKIIRSLGLSVQRKTIKNRVFDYWIPELNLLIERDGEQHYRPAWMGKEQLIEQKKIDKEKRDLALTEGLRFARIPFWVANEYEILIELGNIFQRRPTYPLIPSEAQRNSKPPPRGCHPEMVGQILDKSDVQVSDDWQQVFELLESYFHLTGNSDVPDKFKWFDIRNKQEVNLDVWMRRQRKDREVLSLHQKKKLNRIDFSWIPLKEKGWEQWFALLEAYKVEFGHCYVIQAEVYRGFALGHWVSRQRSAKKKLTLSEDRIKRLEFLGLYWEAADHRWEIMFKQLKEFKKNSGHASPSGTFETDGGIYGESCKKLGVWCDQMRQYKKKDEIPYAIKNHETECYWL